MIKTILAGDLSLACPAFAVVQFDTELKTATVLHLSHVKTNAKKSLGYRLWQIAFHMERQILELYVLDEVVVEKGFSRFPTATQQLQRVVGTFAYTLYRKHNLDFDEIAVTTVKKAVTGKGKAEKDEVAAHLEKYVGKLEYVNNDESDAVAVAIAKAKKEGWI